MKKTTNIEIIKLSEAKNAIRELRRKYEAFEIDEDELIEEMDAWKERIDKASRLGQNFTMIGVTIPPHAQSFDCVWLEKQTPVLKREFDYFIVQNHLNVIYYKN